MKKMFRVYVLVLVLAVFGFAQNFTINPLKSSILEESFQTQIIIQALKKLGYKVKDVEELDYSVAYKILGQHKNSKDVYFLPVNWTPLHDGMMNAIGKKNFFDGGAFIKNCAQGYLIDKKTADKYKIRYIDDLKDPKIAKIFDVNDDGKADLSGCTPGWGCELVIEHQMKDYGLNKTINSHHGNYSALIAEVLSRFKSGKPILFYTWTPYWLSAKLVPNRDVVWLEFKHSSHPTIKDTTLPNGKNFGFSINHQHIIANKSLSKYHPDIAKLFELIKINVNDINAQNMLVADGQKSSEDIKRHANMWIKSHQKLFDGWINEAKKLK